MLKIGHSLIRHRITVSEGSTVFDAGAVSIAMNYRKELMPDQGLCVQVYGEVHGKDTEILRFDCFDQDPHYHYGPENEDGGTVPGIPMNQREADWYFQEYPVEVTTAELLRFRSEYGAGLFIPYDKEEISYNRIGTGCSSGVSCEPRLFCGLLKGNCFSGFT